MSFKLIWKDAVLKRATAERMRRGCETWQVESAAEIGVKKFVLNLS